MDHSFDDIFKALTGNAPYAWQAAMYGDMLAGYFRPKVSLPTGAGKTATIAVWLAALASKASEGNACDFPRRLVWVVDRRVVVDQATEEALEIAQRLRRNQEPCTHWIRSALARLAGATEEPLAVSTLRGELADNGEWVSNPARPAIIVGTVDMIGSRLLFSGYGDGPYRAAQHAGLLGQDALIVNDETHLTPAFAALIERVELMQSGPLKPFKTMRLSATHPGAGAWPTSLAGDETNQHFRNIFRARKRLHLGLRRQHALDLACNLRLPKRVLFFVEKPDAARDWAARIRQRVDADRVITLTGTMRGHERDLLTDSDVYFAFAADKRPEQSCWMVATSAGEVGANISADLLISEPSELDHLLQRFGRANRFAETEADIHILEPEAVHGQSRQAKERQLRISAAVKFLAELPPADENATRDVSPAALFGRQLPDNAVSKPPRLRPLYPWQIENLSQTSLRRHPAREPVQGWLHGQQDSVPEAYVAWRGDVVHLVDADMDQAEILLTRHFPVLARERLREPVDHVRANLTALAASAPDTRFLIRRPDGNVETLALKEVSINTDLDYCQLLLPSGCGRLEGGMWSPQPPLPETEYDISECRERWELIGEGTPTPAGARVTDIALTAAGGEDGPMQCLRYQTDPRPSQPTPEPPYALEDHLRDVAAAARDLAKRCGLEAGVVDALAIAAQFHDDGKRAEIWQSAAGNSDLSKPLAKSHGHTNWRRLAGFRHELASILALRGSDLPPAARDLVLHLIAAHHAWARPHFAVQTYDRREMRASERQATEQARRFGALQQIYGPWGLAYLEAILRAADAQCSAPREVPEVAHA